MFGIPLTAKLDRDSIKSMACHSSCPELSECVSYALHKLQMNDINSQSRTALCYGGYLQASGCVCVAAYWLWKSLCYQVLPFIMDYKHGVVETQRHGLVQVVSPLVALMFDQRSIDCARM